MRALVLLVAAVLLVALALQVAAVGGAWLCHRQGDFDGEIAWLRGMEPIVVWDPGLGAQIDKLARDRIRRALTDPGVDGALRALRLARGRALARSTKPDTELMALGIETFTRVADRFEMRGRLSAAADWDDSLFVWAIRAPEARHRYAALAAFLEGLDLRVRDGQPCAALDRVAWAKRGLGGEIPGFEPRVEIDLVDQCERARRPARRR